MVLNHVDNMCVSLEFHKNRRINLLVYEEVGIMENEKSILNPCKQGVLCNCVRGFEK